MPKKKRCKVCGSGVNVNLEQRCPLCQAAQDAVEAGTTYGKLMAMRAELEQKVRAAQTNQQQPNFRASVAERTGTGRIPARICKICGESFLPWHGNQVVCSDGCRRENIRRHHTPKSTFVHPERQCVICGRTFFGNNNQQICCSWDCSKMRERQRRRECAAKKNEDMEAANG